MNFGAAYGVPEARAVRDTNIIGAPEHPVRVCQHIAIISMVICLGEIN